MTISVSLSSSVSPTIADVLASNQLEQDFTLTETDEATGCPRLTEYWQVHLTHDQQEYVLKLVHLGEPGLAKSVAYCCKHGTVSRICNQGHFAQAYRLRCHDPGCKLCGTRRPRLQAWLRKRDVNAIFAEQQYGIELTIAGLTGSVADRTTTAAHLSARLTKRLNPDTVSVSVIDQNAKDTVVRIVARGVAPSYEEIRQTCAKALRKSSAWCSLKTESDPRSLLLWAFAGNEPVLMLTGSTRADIRVALLRKRLIRVTGTFYACLSPEELRAKREEHESLCSHPRCPVCQDQLPDPIPLTERTQEDVEQIEQRYRYVAWMSDSTLFEAQSLRPRVIPVANYCDKSEASGVRPRYGPS